jgi:hypothetical protein
MLQSSPPASGLPETPVMPVENARGPCPMSANDPA